MTIQNFQTLAGTFEGKVRGFDFFQDDVNSISWIEDFRDVKIWFYIVRLPLNDAGEFVASIEMKIMQNTTEELDKVGQHLINVFSPRLKNKGDFLNFCRSYEFSIPEIFENLQNSKETILEHFHDTDEPQTLKDILKERLANVTPENLQQLAEQNGMTDEDFRALLWLSSRI